MIIDCFFSEPVAVDNYSVITHEENTQDIKTINDLKNKKVGIVEGSAAQEYARQNIKNAEITYFKSYNAMYTALSAHAVIIYFKSMMFTVLIIS